MQPVKASSHALPRLLLFVAGVLVAGALLAPPVFFAAQAVIRNDPGSSLSKLLNTSEFPGYFNRCCMAAAFAGLVPFLRSLQLTRAHTIGIVPARIGRAQLGIGFGIALAWIIGMGVICFMLHACKLKGSPGWSNVLLPLASGFTVATLEEILFRGAILGVLSHSLGAKRGLWWTTGIFAIVHFMKPPADGSFPPESIHWYSGFLVITQLFRGFGQWNNFVGEFLLLVAVGWVLGAARQRTGGLWLSIGLHAGWVAGMKYFGQIVGTTPALRDNAFVPWMVRNTCKAIVSPIVGIVPVLAVLLTGCTVFLLVKRGSDEKGIASEQK